MFYLERTISVEEKIRRAEEIYNRRKGYELRNTTARVNLEKNKNTSVIKKMRNQIIICALIYLIFYGLIHNNFIFSEQLKNKINEILAYEVNVNEIYSQICSYFNNLENRLMKENTNEQQQENTNQQENQDNTQTEGEQNTQNTGSPEDSQDTNNTQNTENPVDTNNPTDNSIGGANEQDIGVNIGEQKELTEEEQMKQEANEIKNNISFIIPLQGTITSKFGVRNPTVSTVSKYHTGLDIGADMGTDIISATDGKVILNSTKGDYGNHLKIEINDIILVYAHCSKLLVNEGEEVKQGQKIAEVGSTGNSTGPHLHFEIRKAGRYIDPQLILDI